MCCLQRMTAFVTLSTAESCACILGRLSLRSERFYKGIINPQIKAAIFFFQVRSWILLDLDVN